MRPGSPEVKTSHMPPRVFENDQIKILWDFQIQTDNSQRCGRWQGRKAREVPAVIGALGAVTTKPGDWLQKIPGNTSDEYNICHSN